MFLLVPHLSLGDIEHQQCCSIIMLFPWSCELASGSISLNSTVSEWNDYVRTLNLIFFIRICNIFSAIIMLRDVHLLQILHCQSNRLCQFATVKGYSLLRVGGYSMLVQRFVYSWYKGEMESIEVYFI